MRRAVTESDKEVSRDRGESTFVIGFCEKDAEPLCEAGIQHNPVDR